MRQLTPHHEILETLIMRLSAPLLRFSVLACLTGGALLYSGLANSQSVALTFDDGPDVESILAGGFVPP
jgi:peptidoglycan/xylan/chitin deacetylase (PgdA/CDA1 family)